MKAVATIFFAGSLALHSSGQKGYYAIPIRHDIDMQWSAESNKVLNLTPKNSEYSLKKWYLDKLKKGAVAAYETNNGGSIVRAYDLSYLNCKSKTG